MIRAVKPSWVAVVLGVVGLLVGAGPTEAQIPAAERAALIDLYNSTNGPGWTNSAGWLGPAGTECTWHGVTCFSFPQVTTLSLGYNNLTGTLPSSIGVFSRLQYLSLNNNQLTGTIPAELGNLARVNEVSLDRNQLSGSIPPELAGLSNLEHLYLFYNQLSGSIPPELGSLSNLTWLGLWSNQLTGTIPPELGTLTNLVSLDLSFNELTGTIPPGLGGLTNLQYLELAENQLTGTIPPALGNLGSLLQLHLHANQLTGTIPASLGNLTNLQYLYLYSNQLTGTIPSELGNLGSLWYLYLYSNQLTGSIPPELGTLANLFSLDLHDNRLSGSIPSELGSLSGLRYLYLGSNQLTGTVPTELESITWLRVVGLESNMLAGPLPPSLLNLNQLYDGESDLRWNALHTSDEALRTYLTSKQVGGDWESTQTIAPTNLAAPGVAPLSVDLAWTPIVYTADSGGYRVLYSTTSGGPYAPFDITADKTTTGMTVTPLAPATAYYFVVETQTNPHANNQNTVVSERTPEIQAMTLPPESDLQVTKTGPDTVAPDQTYSYAVTVTNNGPSTATNVVMTDTMPDSAAFEFSTPGVPTCLYVGGPPNQVVCNLGDMTASSSSVVTITVTAPSTPQELVNLAEVASSTADPDGTNNAAQVTTIVYDPGAFGAALSFLTASAQDDRNIVQWIDPDPGVAFQVMLRYDQAGLYSNCIAPATPGDGTLLDLRTGVPGTHQTFLHSGLGNDNLTYCYSAFVYQGGGLFSAPRSVSARPFSNTGRAKWGFGIGAFSMAFPGSGADRIHIVSNDNAVYAATKGVGGGVWPADWVPPTMPAPAHGRPSSAGVALGGATRVIFLASQDHLTRAVDADTGNVLWTSPDLTASLEAAPAGLLQAYGGSHDAILVGTRDSGIDNLFYGLNLTTGIPDLTVNQGPGGEPIGMIAAQATVDYPNSRAYFTSYARGGTEPSVWCVDLDNNDVLWARRLGDVESAVSLRGDRAYVGNVAGEVYALDTADGSDTTPPFVTGTGPVKSVIFPDRSGTEIYFATDTTVFAAFDDGGGWTLKWRRDDIPSPSASVAWTGWPYVYVGSSNGRLYELDAVDGHSVDAIQLGDPGDPAAVGAPTVDGRGGLLYVPTEAGIVYAVDLLSSPPPECGDGLLAPGEQCDDGGIANGDGCDSTCAIESGASCAGGEPSVCVTSCVDGDSDLYGTGPGCLGLDCDDGDPDVNYGAIELCFDGKDNDCDGDTDCGGPCGPC